MLQLALYFKRLGLACGLGLALLSGILLALHTTRAVQARSVSTTFTVTSTNNAGAGSLRRAILDANANPGADTIVFSLAGCPCVISLTTGLPPITDTLTIIGPGTDHLAVDGNDHVRVFDIDAVVVTMSDLTVQHGKVSDNGAGIRSMGALTLTNVDVLSNTAQLDGGGAYISRTLVLSNTDFISNTAAGSGGGAYAGDGAMLTSAWFERNQSLVGGGLNVGGKLQVNGTVFISNTAVQGGGVYAVGPAQVDGGLFDHNRALYGGGLEVDGELQVTGTDFISNAAQYEGGGLYATGATQIDESIFDHNQANEGGGSYVNSALRLNDTQFIGNLAHADSGAVYAGQTALSGGLFQNNRCVGVVCFGGGLISTGPLSITGTHFIGNVSQRDGGAVFAASVATVTSGLFQNNQCTGSACQGGGLNARDVLTVSNTTFTSNTAQTGGGGLYGVKTTLTGSIFQGNQCAGSFCSGGALMVVGELDLSATQFISNTSQGDGGAVFADKPATLTQIIFQSNSCTGSACLGGGLYAETTLNVNDTQFVRNSSGQGGGLYHNSGTGRIVNDLFASNVATGMSGAALLFASPGRVEIIHTTIANPIATLAPLRGVVRVGGSAIEVQAGTVYLTNTVIANHAIGISNTSGAVSQDYNLFFNNGSDTAGVVSMGTHSVTGDPKFVNGPGDNFHLGPGSAAIDAGTNAGATTDFEGEVRPQGSGFDIGFDESALHDIFLPLIIR